MVKKSQEGYLLEYFEKKVKFPDFGWPTFTTLYDEVQKNIFMAVF